MLAEKVDVDAFDRSLRRGKTFKYFEFGCGGSTERVLRNTNLTVVSVDSSKEWICKVQSRIDTLGVQDRFRSVHVDIGSLREFGHPKDEGRIDAWPTYPATFLPHRDADIVMVDGRFRVACALVAILEATRRPWILFHDFWDRPQHHVILPLVDVIDRGETLLVARAKIPLDREKAMILLARYLHVTG